MYTYVLAPMLPYAVRAGALQPSIDNTLIVFASFIHRSVTYTCVLGGVEKSPLY